MRERGDAHLVGNVSFAGLSETEVQAVESFALLGMEPSRIDRELYLKHGTARKAVCRWWRITRDGRECAAVSRWTLPVMAFANGTEAECAVGVREQDAAHARALVRGAVSTLPVHEQMHVRVDVDGDRSIWLRRV